MPYTALMNNSRLRLFGLIRKEFIQIRRDPSSLGIAFVMPVFLLLLFGYGVSLDARHVPVGLVLEKVSPEARSFIADFEHSDYFSAVHFADMRLAQQALNARKINAIIRLRSNFSRQLYNQQSAPIQVIVDGVDANTARLISSYIQGSWDKWLTHFSAQRGISVSRPIILEPRIWYNSALRSRNFLVPGLIAVIMTYPL